MNEGINFKNLPVQVNTVGIDNMTYPCDVEDLYT